MSIYINGYEADPALMTGDDVIPFVELAGQRDTWTTVTRFSALLDTLPMSGGTANGVLYLNGSKVVTSGSALTFDGTNFGVGGTPLSAAGYSFLRVNGSTGGSLELTSGGTRTLQLQSDSGTSATIQTIANGNNPPLIFGINSSEEMRLNSTGLGIGTNNPGAKLDVRSATTSVAAQLKSAWSDAALIIDRQDLSSNAYVVFRTAGVDGYSLGQFVGGSNALEFRSGGSARMLLDASGNLGLGVTPKTWAGYKALQIDTGTTLASTANQMVLGSNWYFNSGDKYVTTDYATIYIQNSGQHKWYTALSGNAGDPISFTQAMTLDASGRLLVGKTSAYRGGKFVVAAANVSQTSTLANVHITTTDTQAADVGGSLGLGGQIGGDESPFAVVSGRKENGTSGNYAGYLAFATQDAGAAINERARFTSGGDLLVGTTTNYSARLVSVAVNNAAGFINTTSANATAYIWNQSASGDNFFLDFATEAGFTGRGSITYNRAGGLVAYNTTSDYRAKDIIGPVQNPGATIDALKVYEGVMKGATQSRPMLIAHEAQAHAPYAVSGVKDEMNEDGTPKFQQMDVSSLVPLLLAEIQSLRARVAALEA